MFICWFVGVFIGGVWSGDLAYVGCNRHALLVGRGV